MHSSRRLLATSKKTANNRRMTRSATRILARTIEEVTAATARLTAATAAGIEVTAEVIDAEAATAITADEMTAGPAQVEVMVTTRPDEAAPATDTGEDGGIEAVITTAVEDVPARAPPVVIDPVVNGKDLVNAVLVRSAREAVVRRPRLRRLLKMIVINVLSSFSRYRSVQRRATSAHSSRLSDLLLRPKLLKIELPVVQRGKPHHPCAGDMY